MILRAAILMVATVGCGTPSTEPRTKAPDVLPSKPVEVGDRAPMFQVQNATFPGGPKVGLVPGKVNVVWFFATWSNPDKQAMAKADALWDKLKDRGLVVVPVSVDDEVKGVGEFGKASGASFSLGWDDGKKVARQYRPPSEPTWYVVDRKGIVRFIHEGYHDGVMIEIERECESLL